MAPRSARSAYDTANDLPDTKVGTFPQELAGEAKQKGWVVISMALLILIGLRVAGIPGALLLGLVSFLLALIPFGPVLVCGPAAVWLYLEGHIGGAIFVTIWSIAALLSPIPTT